MGVIYKITSPTDRIYIGKTYNLRKRINGHKCSSKKMRSNIMLHNSIAKYGWDAHFLEVVETVDNDLLNEREIYWIKELNTYHYENPQGLNMTRGGDGQRTTWMHKIEQRAAQSKRFTGEGNPFFNKTHSEETKRIISEKTSKRNKESGINVPKWGAEKGRLNRIRTVLAYDNKGNLIGEYESIVNAEVALKIRAISSCLNRNNWYKGMYFFLYKDGTVLNKIEVGEIKLQQVKRPVYFFLGNTVIEYESSERASKELNVPKTSINRAALYNNGKPLRSGHIFIYKDLYEAKMAS